MSTAIPKVLPPDKHPPVCDTKILTDPLGVCELSGELSGALLVPRQAPLPCLGGFASNSAEPQVTKAESVPTTLRRVPSAPRSILSLSHWGSH